jgi:cobalt-zinc-cadmium efflux system outer membrane protein
MPWICVLGLFLCVTRASGQEVLTLPPLTARVTPPALSREAVVRWTLENNPGLAAIRQQRGIAAAGVVIARTYPFNPVLSIREEATAGPESAGITNAVLEQYKLSLDVEMRGQRNIRRQAAAAALTRSEWEIAYGELQVVSRVLRAFDTVLYRQEKQRLNDERIRLNEEAAAKIRKLRDQGKLNPADLILILTEVNDAKAHGGATELALVTAQYELAQAIGAVDGSFVLSGSLTDPRPAMDFTALLEVALEQRPDLRARQTAVAEAEARVRLEQSNRYGNPTIGPTYELDPTRVSSMGVTMTVPLPVFNSHRGEIQMKQAEHARAVLQLRQLEVQVRLDVEAAQARAQRAADWARTYDQQVLPNLRKSLEAVEDLFTQSQPGVDVVRVLEIRRNLLKGREAYLDALWELAQARADLVAAVGDLRLVLGPDAVPCPPQQ